MNFLYKPIILILISCLPLKGCGNSNGNREMGNSSNDSSSTLLEAVAERDNKRVTELLRTKPNLEIKDSSGRTALMIAAYNHDNKIAELLIAAGANVNAQDNIQNSPFLYAGAEGNVALLNMALENGADFNLYNRYGGTALIPAAEKLHVEIVKILTDIPNYPINHVNKLGWTALLEAIILSPPGKKQVEIVKILVDAGSNVHIADKDGITPLQHAKNRSMNEIVDILQKASSRK